MRIKRLVERLIRNCGTNDPFALASQKNILVLMEPLGSIMGYYNTYKRVHMIHINYALSETEKRFTCSHELGHALLHPKLNTPFLKRNTLFSIDRIEREANRFAVELLMPDQVLGNYATLEQAAAACGVPLRFTTLKQMPEAADEPQQRSLWHDEDSFIAFKP